MLNNLKRSFQILACLLTCFTSSSVAFIRKTSPKIIIVGGGPAGIASAVRLVEYGFTDVTILEAEPRIGGRIHTIPFGMNVIDMGAQWCHGEEGNIVYELAYKEGILEHSHDGSDTYSYVRSNAELLTRDIVERLLNITHQIKEYRKIEVSDYKGSLGSYMRKKFDELLALPENADVDKKIANEFYGMFEKEESSDEGVDTLNVISSRDYMIFEEIEGDYELNWKDKGYKEFLRLLMRTKETGTEYGVLDERIKVNKKVKHISWSRNDFKTLVQCEDGEEFLADHVIVTVSLGVLKENHEHMFEPPLPKEKQNAIRRLQYGSFSKVFLEFSERFWSDDWDGIYFLWREEDLQDIRGTNRSWLEGVYSFNTLPYQPFVLEGWIIGEGSRYMEKLPLEQIKEDSLYLLKKFLPPSIPDVVNVTISYWYSNPNFRGCYSSHSQETEKANVTNQQLAEAIRNCDIENFVEMCEKPVLQFAGEATHTKYYATVHGAVESGFREAERISEYYKNENGMIK